VGDHSWSHPQLPLLTPSQILWQMRSTADTIQRVIKVRPTFFRPPYGEYDSQVLTQANRLGLTTVLWNDDPRDWSLPGTTGIISWILSQASNGSIILLHDGGGNRWQTVAALPTLIEGLQREGFTLVTLQQMVDEVHGTHTRPRPPLIKPPRAIPQGRGNPAGRPQGSPLLYTGLAVAPDEGHTRVFLLFAGRVLLR
jgi:peptidoglycan/xylan/chitin deacetylase (PgdA/CDA1 family)